MNFIVMIKKLRFRKIKFPGHDLKAKYQAEPVLKSELSTFHCKGSLLLLCCFGKNSHRLNSVYKMSWPNRHRGEAFSKNENYVNLILPSPWCDHLPWQLTNLSLIEKQNKVHLGACDHTSNANWGAEVMSNDQRKHHLLAKDPVFRTLEKMSSGTMD